MDVHRPIGVANELKTNEFSKVLLDELELFGQFLDERIPKRRVFWPKSPATRNGCVTLHEGKLVVVLKRENKLTSCTSFFNPPADKLELLRSAWAKNVFTSRGTAQSSFPEEHDCVDPRLVLEDAGIGDKAAALLKRPRHRCKLNVVLVWLQISRSDNSGQRGISRSDSTIRCRRCRGETRHTCLENHPEKSKQQLTLTRTCRKHVTANQLLPHIARQR